MIHNSAQRADLLASHSPHALVAFLTIQHGSLGQPLRVVNDGAPYVYGGQRYGAASFGYRLVPDAEQAPRTVLQVQNIDGKIGQALRLTDKGARVELELLSTADFDLSVNPRTEIGTAEIYEYYRDFVIKSVTVDAVLVEGRLGSKEYTQEPWPKTRATQNSLPGLFV